jgi:hypothetical protein
MDSDLSNSFEWHAHKVAADLERRARELRAFEWPGTGCCPEAQADGVPCPNPACACDTCGRAGKTGD